MPDKQQPILEMRDVCVGVSALGEKPILNHIDLRLNIGEMLGIVSETGSGKSMMLQTILQLLPGKTRMHAGEIRYEGTAVSEMSEKQLQQWRGREVGLIVSNPRSVLDPITTIGKQIVQVIRSHQKVDRLEAVAQAIALLQQLEIPDALRRFDAYPHEMSGGMCQRIVIAMALANGPKLILADEPTSGLDVTVQRQVLDLMAHQLEHHHTSAIIVTRDLGIVAQYCHKIAVLKEGQIIEINDVVSFFESPRHEYSQRLLELTRAEGRENDDGAA